jgi:beta-phosphoglucomutase-like phosphatase (HAD superfamily)
VSPDLGPRSFSTLLCDADGNLFPSEEPAFEASSGATNRLLERFGSSVRYTADELRAVALGRNFRALAQDLAVEHGVDLGAEELEQWVALEQRLVVDHLREVLRPDPGLQAALRRLAGGFDLAVVSSSALARLDVCFEVTGLAGMFPQAERFSAQDSLPAPTSKPDPAVYAHAVQALGLEPHRALAVEDAVSGVASAVAAGVPVVGNLAFVPPEERVTRKDALMDAGALTVVKDWDCLGDLLGLPATTGQELPA